MHIMLIYYVQYISSTSYEECASGVIDDKPDHIIEWLKTVVPSLPLSSHENLCIVVTNDMVYTLYIYIYVQYLYTCAYIMCMCVLHIF